MGALKVSSDQVFFRQMKKIKNSLYPMFKKKFNKFRNKQKKL